jgi:protein-glutamine gamma-glutamyltransferase
VNTTLRPNDGLRERLAHLPRDTRDTLFLLALIAWTAMPQTPNLPWWAIALTGFVLVWRGVLAWRGKPLPSKWWLLGFLALSVAGTYLTHKTIVGREAGVTLIVMLMALKTLELRARRDAFVVFFLAFFAMLTNFFYSQSLLTAAAMLVAVLGWLTALVNAHMLVGKPPLQESLKTALWMAALGAPIMAALFVLFPRFAPLWGIPSDGQTGRSGLSGSMQVGNVASLALDDSIAFRIKWADQPPLPQDLYWRGPVLGDFDGREWQPSGGLLLGLARGTIDPQRTAQRMLQLGDTPARLSVAGDPVKYQITLEPSNRPWLMVLDAAIEAPKAAGYEVAMTPSLMWITGRAVTDIVRYDAQSHPTFRHGPAVRNEAMEPYLKLPPGFNTRTLALAAELRRDPALATAGASAVVDAVAQRLRTGGYVYTLEPGVYGANTADEFWFDKKAGFCEHIASAFVILMRAMDVPARIVTGYQGGELNSVDGFWVVRQRDAHAWAEVWDADRGWIRVDPTGFVSPGRIGAFQRLAAPQGIVGNVVATLSPGMAQRLRNVWDAVNNAWNQRILNYTQSKQLDLLKNLGIGSPSWEHLAYVLLGLMVVASTAGAVWTWFEKRHRDPWVRMLDQARKKLQAAGVDAAASSPARELAERARAQLGAAAEPAAEWLLAYERSRYAPASAARSTLDQMKRAFKQITWPAQAAR